MTSGYFTWATDRSKSLMNKFHSLGPRTVPWGTPPPVKSFKEDMHFFNLTQCWQFVKKSRINLTTLCIKFQSNDLRDGEIRCIWIFNLTHLEPFSIELTNPYTLLRVPTNLKSSIVTFVIQVENFDVTLGHNFYARFSVSKSLEGKLKANSAYNPLFGFATCHLRWLNHATALCIRGHSS